MFWALRVGGWDTPGVSVSCKWTLGRPAPEGPPVQRPPVSPPQGGSLRCGDTSLGPRQTLDWTPLYNHSTEVPRKGKQGDVPASEMTLEMNKVASDVRRGWGPARVDSVCPAAARSGELPRTWAGLFRRALGSAPGCGRPPSALEALAHTAPLRALTGGPLPAPGRHRRPGRPGPGERLGKQARAQGLVRCAGTPASLSDAPELCPGAPVLTWN